MPGSTRASASGSESSHEVVLASLLAQQDGRVRTLPSSSCSFSPLSSPISSPPTATASRRPTSASDRRAITGSAPTTSDATCSRGSSTARASRSRSALLATLMAVMIGTTFGAIAGFFGGGTDIADDADRRHLLVDPLHHPRRVDRHVVRAQCQFADHRPRAHRLVGHRPRRAGIVPQHQEDGVRRGGAGPRFRPHADDLRPPAAERFRADHRLRHDRHRRRRSWPRRRCRSSGSGRRRRRRRGD